jgi:hypothetical protein
VKNIYLLVSIIILSGFSLFAQTNLDSGLVAYWPFNGNADDESGNGHGGTLQGGVTLSDDRFGNPESAYTFNGIDGRIDYGLLWSGGNAPSSLTMAAWFNYAQTGDEGKIIYHGWTGEFQLLAIGNTAAAAVHLSSGWYNTHVMIASDTWYFLVATWEQGGQLLLYLDGQPMDTTGVPNKPLDQQPTTYYPSIGSYNQSAGAFFTGMIDDIRVYNRVLTQEEIDSLNNEGISSVEMTNALIPEEFKLNQNYPNPFNPSTTVNFSIPEASFVSLKIFNSLGEEVETLVAEELVGGNYKYNWNAVNLPSGIYFYTLIAESFSQTKKMILLK